MLELHFTAHRQSGCNQFVSVTDPCDHTPRVSVSQTQSIAIIVDAANEENLFLLRRLWARFWPEMMFSGGRAGGGDSLTLSLIARNEQRFRGFPLRVEMKGQVVPLHKRGSEEVSLPSLLLCPPPSETLQLFNFLPLKKKNHNFIQMLKTFSCWWIIFCFCTIMSNPRALVLKTNLTIKIPERESGSRPCHKRLKNWNTKRLKCITNAVRGTGLVRTRQHVSQMRLSKFILLLPPDSLSDKWMFVCSWKLSLRAAHISSSSKVETRRCMQAFGKYWN